MIKTIIRFISPQVFSGVNESARGEKERAKIPESLEKFPEKSAVTPRRILHGCATTLTRSRGRRGAASLVRKHLENLECWTDGRRAKPSRMEKGAEARMGPGEAGNAAFVYVYIRTVGPVGLRDKVGI